MGSSMHNGASDVLKLHPVLLVVVLSAALFFAASAWSPPLIYEDIAGWAGSWQKKLFSFVCHQQIDRSFHIGGVPLAVCSRCTGIYSGLLSGLMIFSVIYASVNYWKHYITGIFLIGSLAAVVDGSANILELWSTADSYRSVIGAVWGFSAGGLLVFAIIIPREKK